MKQQYNQQDVQRTKRRSTRMLLEEISVNRGASVIRCVGPQLLTHPITSKSATETRRVKGERRRDFELVAHTVIITADDRQNYVFTVFNKDRGYEIPGGHVRVGESVTEAWLRELKEEGTQLHAQNQWFDRLRCFSDFTSDFVTTYDIGNRGFVDFARVLFATKKIKLGSAPTRESDRSARWLPITDLMSMIKIKSINSQNIIALYPVIHSALALAHVSQKLQVEPK